MGAGLLVGAEGWEHPGWDGVFYPDDLPPEWRLTYYGNEFPLLLVPSAVWRAASRAQFADWREDVPERFRFVLDVTDADPGDQGILAQLRDCQSALGTTLAGAVCWSPPGPDGRRALRSVLGDTRFLAEPVPLPGLPASVRVAEDGGVCCALVTDHTGLDLKWLRGVLEQLSGRLRDETVPMLFFSGRPPAIKQMGDATVLWQLLGGLQSQG